MMKKLYWLLAMLIWILVACSQGDYSDLDEFIKNSGQGLQGKVDSLPEVKTYQQFTYAAFDIPDPFMPRKNDRAKQINSGLQPNLKRHKEALENFPLENMRMVGSLQRNKTVIAIIKTPDNTLHRAVVGNYLGQDFGKIFSVSETLVMLKEIVQDSNTDEWIKRVKTLILEGREQEK